MAIVGERPLTMMAMNEIEGKPMRKQVFDVADIIEFERRLAADGVALDGLMRRAGAAVADAAIALAVGSREAVERHLPPLDLRGVCGACSISRCAIRKTCGEGFPYTLPRVLIFAGPGNNGGDGWTAADVLLDAGCNVTLVTPCAPHDLRVEPARSEAVRVSGKVPYLVNPSVDELRPLLDEADVVIDAMLSIGFMGKSIREPMATWVRLVNEARERGSRGAHGARGVYGESGAQGARGVRVVSVDVPSGLSAQTGEQADPCIQADVTVTMIACKPGLLLPSAAERVGELINASIGVNLSRHARLIPNPRPMWELEEYLENTYEPARRSVSFAARLSDVYGGEAEYADAALSPAYPAFGSGLAPESAFEPAQAPAQAAPAPAPAYGEPEAVRFAPAHAAAAPKDVPDDVCSDSCMLEAPRQMDLLDMLDGLDEPFSVLLMEIIDERGMTDVEVYKRAGMSRQLFSKIRSSADYRPAKKTVIALAVALRLTLDETQVLLERAGFALSHSSKADVIVEYFIVNELYDVMAINEALYSYDQPLL